MKQYTNEFCLQTSEYLENSDINHRKRLGQYFTPKHLRDRLLAFIPNDIENLDILDPACGTGEFLVSSREYFRNPNLFGWEIDSNLVKIAKTICPNSEVLEVDSLNFEPNRKFDVIIGNPPYFQFQLGKNQKEKFEEVIGGRVNIFSLFIYRAITLLKDGGYLAFVVPPSMNNGAYFSKLREFIVRNANIEKIDVVKGNDFFDQAQQTVMLLVLKKGRNEGDYLFERNGISIFTEDRNRLVKLLSGRKSLFDLGFKVKTGSIVWNQNKSKLTRYEIDGAIPLIWSHNISETGLKFPIDHPKKPQYIVSDKYEIGPAIVVNRIVGSVKNARLRSAIIPEGMKFLAENHANVITQNNNLFQTSSISLEKLNEQLNSIQNLEILHYLTGNTQISKNELEKLFPIEISN